MHALVFMEGLLMAKDLREHQTNLRATQSASRPLRVHRPRFVRAELDLCAREDRIVSETDDWSMQEELSNYM